MRLMSRRVSFLWIAVLACQLAIAVGLKSEESHLLYALC